MSPEWNLVHLVFGLSVCLSCTCAWKKKTFFNYCKVIPFWIARNRDWDFIFEHAYSNDKIHSNISCICTKFSLTLNMAFILKLVFCETHVVPAKAKRYRGSQTDDIQILMWCFASLAPQLAVLAIHPPMNNIKDRLYYIIFGRIAKQFRLILFYFLDNILKIQT